MITAFAAPFAYCLLIGFAWSQTFKKRFCVSVGIAFFTQMLFVLVSGLTIGYLLPGLLAGIGAAAVLLLYGIIRDSRQGKRMSVRLWITENLFAEDVLLFCLFYVICFVLNTGKRFITWDELSHWGMFLKESLRLNKFYCVSEFSFSHKDYVPAMTLLEWIWCTLCRRFSEADVYRCIQVIMFSLIFPMFEPLFAEKQDSQGKKDRVIWLGMTVLIILLLPLIFNTADGFYFYHSIYCDFATGVFVFFCVYEVYKTRDSMNYRLLVLTLGMTGLALIKMTAMAFLPALWVYFVVKEFMFDRQEVAGKRLWKLLPPLVVPIGFWLWFNRFVDHYVTNTGSVQSYDGMKLSMLFDVFFRPEITGISYLPDVSRSYITAVFTRNIILHGSYAVILGGITFVVYLIAARQKEATDRAQVRLAALWILLMGIAHALLMYFLYMTSFTEAEARRLASYARYMNTFTVPALLFAFAIFIKHISGEERKRVTRTILAVLTVGLCFFHIDVFKQLLPGKLVHDTWLVEEYSEASAKIRKNTDMDDRIYVMSRGDNGKVRFYLRYYCSPRHISGSSVGPAVNADDIYSVNMEPIELVNTLSEYTHLYVGVLDDVFLERYQDVFEDVSLLQSQSIYRIEITEDMKIRVMN